ncbi:MAG: hypothetical protein BWX70_03013 [Verrucomicrobia bacterium ADurb.Bin070]|nr:MAG: hypothetical protein BWX70_03013 [Verrucomicrobia bacterium ADurb.Bin070]
MLERGLHLAQPGQQPHALGFLRRFGQRHPQRVQLMLHLRQAGDPAQRIFNQRFGVGLRLEMLADMSDARRLLDDDLAGVGIRLAQDQAEERGLAGTVRADDPDPFAGIDAETDIAEDLLRAVMHADITKFNHGRV